MKKGRIIWIYPLLVMGVLLMLINSCKKSDDNNNEIPSNTMTDIDGNVYHFITIGTQVWMVENLKVTKFNDGTLIPLVTDNTAWGDLSAPGYCWYNNDPSTYKNTYGALYNWYAVNTGKLAPTGWHVPTATDWCKLVTYLDATVDCSAIGFSGTDAGNKMKETGTTHWISPNAGATNSSGFTALPGGGRGIDGHFGPLGSDAVFWYSNEYSSSQAWYLSLYYQYAGASRNYTEKQNGFSIRCIKD